ncbi:MAG: leucine-rich repeat protein [Spirochaetaceae bacterium]|nr:leucine-rich repeat protein [Spirochaetaceae bacterium]
MQREKDEGQTTVQFKKNDKIAKKMFDKLEIPCENTLVYHFWYTRNISLEVLMSRLHLNHSNFRAETVLRTAPSKYPPPYVLKRAEGYFAATILKVALPLLLILLLAGCPHNNSIETRTLSYDANLPEGHSLSSGTLPGTKVYMKGAKVVVAAAGGLATDAGGVGTGWNTQPDGSGADYYEGDELVLDADTTLYATWALPVRVLDSTEAAQAIEELEDGESVKIEIEGAVDFEKLKTALAATKGKVELDLSQADKFTSIDSGAFQDAAGLTSLVLPGTVTSIGSSAFANSGLTSLIIRDDASQITIETDAIPEGAKILVPEGSLEACLNKNQGLKDKIFPSTVTITVEWTGAGTSGASFKSEYVGDYGTPTGIPKTPETPANFTFKGWVDNDGRNVTLPATFEESKEIQANATFVNAAGYPVYPAYLTVQRTSYAAAENDDVGQEKPSWAGGDKTYSTQIADRPMTHTPYDAFIFDGTSQQPTKGQLVVTTGNTTGIGSFRIPALNKLVKPDGTIRLFAAADIRYRGHAEGDGDCGDSSKGGSDFLIAYSDDGGATWTRRAIDVPNFFNEKGETVQAATYGHDLGDPQLWTVGNTIYVGGVTGTGILKRSGNKNSGFRVFKSVDYGETWTEDTDISSGRNTYSFLWNDSTGSLIQASEPGYANLPCPGHGIVLTQDVPDTNMKKGMTVVPMQGGAGTFKAYLVYGAGEPSTWEKTGSPAIDASAGNGEWQVCQLDDGTVFGVGKTSGKRITNARYTSTGWTEIASDPWIPRGASQSSVLKVMDGNGSDKHGVVAFTSPKTAGSKALSGQDGNVDEGRDKVTISFGRDISGTVSGDQSPIDSSERYYIQIRKMGQRSFGYSDMVMVDNEILGVIYECSDNSNNDIDGLRFMTIDVSEVVKKLSVKN